MMKPRVKIGTRAPDTAENRERLAHWRLRMAAHQYCVTIGAEPPRSVVLSAQRIDKVGEPVYGNAAFAVAVALFIGVSVYYATGWFNSTGPTVLVQDCARANYGKPMTGPGLERVEPTAARPLRNQ